MSQIQASTFEMIQLCAAGGFVSTGLCLVLLADKLRELEALYHKVLDAQMRELGIGHKHTQETLKSLFGLLRHGGKLPVHSEPLSCT